MPRARDLLILGGVAAIATVVARHLRGAGGGHGVAGGVVMDDAAAYDLVTRVALGAFFAGVAADVARVAPAGARVLEVGCGPGHLTRRLARAGFDVTGVDLDPGMIERARANARGSTDGGNSAFVVGDAAALPFSDASFDIIVSTLSMHHWDDRAAGLAEIARVLRPGGIVLVWDFRPGTGAHPFAPRHGHEGLAEMHGPGLRVVSAAPWRWPWRFSFVERMELVRV